MYRRKRFLWLKVFDIFYLQKYLVTAKEMLTFLNFTVTWLIFWYFSCIYLAKSQELRRRANFDFYMLIASLNKCVWNKLLKKINKHSAQ